MFNCHVIPYLIRAQYRITLIVLMFIIGSQNVSAQIAQDAYAIFEQRCLICHGPDGAYRETLLIEHNALIGEGSVVPGNPDASELYNRLLTTDLAKRMPLAQPQLSPQAVDTIRNWILAGAPDWAVTSTTDGDFISPSEILNTIETHLMSLSAFDRAFARYFTMTHLYNAGETPRRLQEYRKGLYKLVNSLSWGVTVTNPQPIDPQGTIFYIDLRHYEWDVNDGWTQIEKEYPYHIAFNAATQTALREQLGRLQTEMNCDVPSVHIDWFLATASLPPLYHELLSLPLTDRELETRLEVDVVRNLRNAPGVRVWRAGTNDSGVSNHNRVIERHTSRYGAYWKSYDFAGSVGTQNIFTYPLSFTHDGGEVIFNLPNGLQGYYLANASGFRLDDAPINIVSNPAASDPTVRNGLSCLGCHTDGMKTFEDQVRSVIESNATPAYDKAQALRLYVEQSAMDALVQADTDRYKAALAATGGAFGDIEPISRFHEAFEGSVDAAYAAAVVGLETAAFQEKIRENIGLQNAGLLVLEGENGSMKRDAWTSRFRDVIFALDFPEQFTPPTVITPPEQTPSAVVHIPDPNLRAAIAEALGKGPNAPITVEEMGRLGRLEALNKGIRDLTGLQVATNLRFLRLDDNEVSDLSPLAGLVNLGELWLHENLLSDISPVRSLTNLTRLEVDHSNVSDISPVRNLTNLTYLEIDHTLVSDISPVRGLTNLTHLELDETLISDLSPLAGLINLKGLGINRTNVSDLSPLAGLINLEWLRFSGRGISDLSPLAGLINLRDVRQWDNPISDLSPLAGLTKLEAIDFCNGNISDLTPLVGLTGLEELYLAGQNISDISPLTGLTGLTRMNLERNNISGVSPLAGLTNLTWLNLEHNDISGVSPLAGLTNLTWLSVADNDISDISPLARLRENITFLWHENPVFPKGGPKIEGPWLWVVLPDTVGERLNDTDLLSEASGGTVKETEIATHGATVGKSVGDSVWTSHRLPPAGGNNIEDMLKRTIPNGAIYGTVSLYSPQEQDTTMYVGGDRGVRAWLNGTLIYENLGGRGSSDYSDFFPVTLQQGSNVLLVAVHTLGNGFFGFEPGTEYTISNPSVGYAFSNSSIHTGDTFTLDIRAENIFDLAGWQFDIEFAPAALEAINVTEGDFLKADSGTTFFQGGSIDNAAGKITGLSAVRLSSSGVSGTGTLLQVRFKAKSGGETELMLQNFQFASVTGDSIPAGPHKIRIAVEGQLATGDVNRDGVVSVVDLVLVAQQLGKRVPANSPVDANGDGVVSILDLILVSQGIGKTTASAAPPLIPPQVSSSRSVGVSSSRSIGAGGERMLDAARREGIVDPVGRESMVDAALIEEWIVQARVADDGSLAFKEGIENLQKLLASMIPEETALLANYPNPFNPETWIPYQLAESAEVTLTIYDMNGGVVRRLAVGHRAAGMYQNRSRAAYWDGRNQLGESVASGLYFYTLTAGEFTATRRMLILK